ncbi:MAG: TonB-dependent receptor [Nitrospiraceae bacterium]
MRSIVGHMQQWAFGVGVVVAAPLAWSVMGTTATAQEPTPAELATMGDRERALRQDLQKILTELDEIQKGKEGKPGEPAAAATPTVTKTVEPSTPEESPEYDLADVSIVSTRHQRRPEGLSQSSTLPAETDSQPTRTLRESMESVPGVVLRQANGPRDFSLAIRGSGVKTTFAVRDIKMYEDGFVQTQSDGLSRLDLHDPWFMRSVEVTRGASSSLYDNYALGGMVHFRTRRGSDINGAEAFLSGGSYGYQKYAFAVGQQFKNLDVSLFGSQVVEDGFIRHSGYDTQTMNFNFRFTIDDKQNFYFKAITNWLNAQVPTRLTMAQFAADPRQAGGTSAINDAVRLAQRRLDRRTIVGGMYEREIDANTVLTMEFDYDVKDINQTFTQISDNINPTYKHYTDLRHDGRVGEMPLRSYVGFFVNQMEQEGQTFNNLGDFFGTRGTLSQNSRGTIRNIGGRFREELQFMPKWTLAAGLGFEQSQLSVQTISYNAAGSVTGRPSAERSFTNWAPEVSLTWKPADGYRHWARASTGYGIPGFSNLTIDPFTGLAGSNFNLKPQKNYNFEVGTEAKLHRTFSVALTGFWVLFKNEIISQVVSSTGGVASINADSSEYRGIEFAYDWRPWEGWRFSGAYTHTDSRYINFNDRFLVAGAPTFFSRDGKAVPNVPTDVLNFKEEYEHVASGWGGWFETSYWNSYFLNNNNTVGAPSYWLLNANIHKTFSVPNNKWFRFAKLYLQLDNLLDKTYVASGNVLADSTPDANKTLFFAGYGRAIYGGVTLGLF